MKLRALSSYNGDSDTRFGDCILIYGDANLVVYDCGHDDHAREVGAFLQAHPEINQIHVSFLTMTAITQMVFNPCLRISARRDTL